MTSHLAEEFLPVFDVSDEQAVVVVDEVGGVVTEADGVAALLLPLHAAASSTSASSPLRRTGRRYEMGGNYVK